MLIGINGGRASTIGDPDAVVMTIKRMTVSLTV